MRGWRSSWRNLSAATVLAACGASASLAAEPTSGTTEAKKAPAQPPAVVQRDGQNVQVEIRAVEAKPGEKSNVLYFQTTEPVAGGTGTITVTGVAISPEERQRLEKEIADLEATARELKQAGKARAAQAVAEEVEKLKRRLAGPLTVTAAGGMGGMGMGGMGMGGMGMGGMGMGGMGMGGMGMGGGVPGPVLNLTPEEREAPHETPQGRCGGTAAGRPERPG